MCPDWLLTVQEMPRADLFSDSLEPTEKLLEAPERFGISATAGAAGGMLGKKLVEKVLKKEFFGKIVGRISSALTTRVAGGAAGAAAGSIVPGIGTIAGFAAGTAIGIGADYGMLKLDEAQNREIYKQEIGRCYRGTEGRDSCGCAGWRVTADRDAPLRIYAFKRCFA